MLTCSVLLRRLVANRASTILSKRQLSVARSSFANNIAVPMVSTNVGRKSLSVQWEDGKARFHYLWLRHHCLCNECVDPKTKQRMVDLALIPTQTNPKHVDVASNSLQIIWEDGHETCFDVSWLKENAYDGLLSETKHRQESKYGSVAYKSDVTLWNRDEILSKPPKEFTYRDIMNAGNHAMLNESLNSLFRYGYVFVNETPLDEESTLKIGQNIVGPIRETVEGRIYVIENKALQNSDLSHFSNALHGHTDFSFYSDPPGIQVLHCTHHQGTGGMSLLVDGFKAAKTLYEENPDAFEILSSTPLRYKSSHYSIESNGTILELDTFTKALTRIRWNNSRIGALTNVTLNFEEMEMFYQAMRLFGSIVRREENEYWFKLTPGKVLLMDNRRLLHGRSAIQGPRKLMGYYISGDDYIGKWKGNQMKLNN